MNGFDLRVDDNNISFFIDNYFIGATKKIGDIITESLYTIEANAKSACPVDTGDLRQSIQTVPFDGKKGKVECAENRNPPVGAYVEFGTGSQVQVPEGMEDYAMQFYVNGKGHLPARPFLFPAFFSEQDNLIQSVKDAL